MDDGVDTGDEPRFRSPCPQCGYSMTGGVLGSGDPHMVLSLQCLRCGYAALVDPFA